MKGPWTATILATVLVTASTCACPPRCEQVGTLVVPVGCPVKVRCHEVLYRTCRSEPWRLYGSYSERKHARDAERALERAGYQTRVDHHTLKVAE